MINSPENLELAGLRESRDYWKHSEEVCRAQYDKLLGERDALAARGEALEGDNARLLGVLNKIANMRPVMEVSGQFPDLSTLPCQQLARQALENSSHEG